MLPLLILLAAPALAGDRPAYAPKRLALVRQVAHVAASPDGKDAFFVTDITGAMELWRVPSSGGWPTQLTDLGEQVVDVDVSSDGARVIVASDYGGDERPDLFL